MHSHHVQSKQQPKTPGARYPKTPSKLPRNDENAPAGLIGKSGIKNGIKFGENNMLQTKGKGAQQGLVTPLGMLESEYRYSMRLTWNQIIGLAPL